MYIYVLKIQRHPSERLCTVWFRENEKNARDGECFGNGCSDTLLRTEVPPPTSGLNTTNLYPSCFIEVRTSKGVKGRRGRDCASHLPDACLGFTVLPYSTQKPQEMGRASDNIIPYITFNHSSALGN